MNVVIIAQCNKKALKKTRQIVDQFAERKGTRTWVTRITQEGLNTLRRLLSKTARRNTAVACHVIRGAYNTELRWVVGNRSMFDLDGNVPTNTTKKDILRAGDENGWATGHALSIFAGIAGLFHDVGKANVLFQKKLKSNKKVAEPFRHEWVSLKIFEAFVDQRSDTQWLAALKEVCDQSEIQMLGRLAELDKEKQPFTTLPPLAQVVAWLIVSHHKLPTKHHSKGSIPLNDTQNWLNNLDDSWNANVLFPAEDKQNQDNWTFKHGTPLRSQVWQRKALQLAKRAEQNMSVLERVNLDDLFTVHLSRLVLMLADHHYSSQEAHAYWQDKSYKAYANTDRTTNKLKQRLDEHNIGVGHHAYLLAKQLPQLQRDLPAITRHKQLQQRVGIKKFAWQNKAFELARGVRQSAEKYGFFGVNMASTGCGKTFANAKIMYGLSHEKIGCRFSVALGLRTLTLQTADAFQDKLKLNELDLATLIGSQAVQDLHQAQGTPKQQAVTTDWLDQLGSASAQDFLAEEHVRYEGCLYDGALRQWLSNHNKLNKLVSAPITVSTIDYLIQATEGTRGGKQIAPMLRLLTSDLVLDEPDDFGLDDLPALLRLVHWAGLLGSRVLLSSATMPPALTCALFSAYEQGRRYFQNVRGAKNEATKIVCAWFDEFGAQQTQITGQPDIKAIRKAYREQHQLFTERRLKHLNQVKQPLRQGYFVEVPFGTDQPKAELYPILAHCIQHTAIDLHTRHAMRHPSGQTASVGLVRMANIQPLVQVADQLMQLPEVPEIQFHLCVYHARFPLLVRSCIEHQLDQVLMRDPKHPEAFWEVPKIKNALKKSKARRHIFLVLATPVAEVGRDHDYDWAIIEPSSMRSIIQLAGRVQRHRQQVPTSPNIAILNQNVRALLKREPAYTRPGFETKADEFKGHYNLNTPEMQACIQTIDTTYRSQCYAAPAKVAPRWIKLEHQALQYKMLIASKKRKNYPALLYLERYASLMGQFQKQQRFRESEPQSAYVIQVNEDTEALEFGFLDDDKHRTFQTTHQITSWQAQNWQACNQIWLGMDYVSIYTETAARLKNELSFVNKHMAEINLNPDKEWLFHEFLGVFEKFK